MQQAKHGLETSQTDSAAWRQGWQSNDKLMDDDDGRSVGTDRQTTMMTVGPGRDHWTVDGQSRRRSPAYSNTIYQITAINTNTNSAKFS